MMLMKLGWKEGEGLGKNKHGMTDLIPVNIKTDRKGCYGVRVCYGVVVVWGVLWYCGCVRYVVAVTL